MNLEVFNRVNWKESYHSGGRYGRYRSHNSIHGMYSKWTSLTNKLYNRSCRENLEEKSVLRKFSPSAGKQVTVLIVKQLASTLGIAHAAEPSNLTSENEVYWCMEVVCYGLTLPLTEHDTVRDCVNVYCEWLSALYPVPKISVPKPVCKDANFYARKIIAHFLNLFMPRSGEGSDIINKQAVLCHRVLRTLQHLTQVSKSIENDTWQTLLLFLLTINDTLLAPPTVKDDVGDQLCERVLSVLLEIWLTACIKCYPSPPLWKTLREMAINWRHRTALIEQWNRINLTLASRVLEIMYGVSFPQLRIAGDEDLQTTVASMREECVVQTWYRVLHTIGNPVDLCHSNIISQTPQFLQYALTSDNPSEHQCLSVLPFNFYKAIKGVASLVDAFLGAPLLIQWEDYSSFQQNSIGGCNPSLNVTIAGDLCSPTPPSRRRLAKSFSVTSSKNVSKNTGPSTAKNISSLSNPNTSGQASSCGASSLNYFSHHNPNSRNALLSPLRPKCNSVLHLFGEWLFEASYNAEISRLNAPTIPGSTNFGTARNVNWAMASGETGSISSGSTSSFWQRKGSSSQPNSLTTDSSDPDTGASSLANSLSTISSFYDKFVCGRAEAVGTLCRIFCAKKTGEEILPIYLSRFYLIIQQGLRVKEYGECDEVMASILLNSTDVFSVDLDGVLLLVPYYVEALEIVLPERNLRFNENVISTNNPIALVSLNPTTNVPPGNSTSSNVATSNHGNIISTSVAAVSATTCTYISSVTTVSASAATPIASTIGSGTSVSWAASSSVSSNLNSLSNTSASNVIDSYQETNPTFNYTPTTQNIVDADSSSTFVSGSSGLVIQANTATGGSSASICSNVTNSSIASTITSNAMALVELRKACINLLLSMLPLPLHFQNLPIKEFGNVACRLNTYTNGITFGQLKPHLVNLLINALQIENDNCNAHLLLGGLWFLVQDSALSEQTNDSNWPVSENPCDISSTILSSESAASLFVKSMHLVCHRLISIWKMDLNVSLAALEFLSGLARIQIRGMDILEYKRAINWLCEFITHQCRRPPQAHSKDLHSSIVAAFQCAAHWLISHPLLLNDKECLNVLLEVVELGISGTKSLGKLNEPIRMKDEKESKPVSLRVRDAADALLTIILEQIGNTGANSSICLLDEVILLKQCSSTSNDINAWPYEQAVSKFQYFIFESNIMIALLQEPLGNDQDPQPTITLLIRNGFGRHAWTLQLRHLPRHRSTSKQNYSSSMTISTGRPISMVEACCIPDVHQRYFPDCISRIDTYKADKSIPTLESVVSNDDNKLESLIEQQYLAECETYTERNSTFRECIPPSTCHEFFTARMFLCHLGLLSKFRSPSLSNNTKPNEICSLIALDNQKEGFAGELRLLDQITAKTCDTCHVFYVKTGQKRYSDILENTMSRSGVCSDFIELLYSLGWPVKVDQHIGWTGHVSTSYNLVYDNVNASSSIPPNDCSSAEKLDQGVGLYDGRKRIIYWSDAISEIAFVVPSLKQPLLPNTTRNWCERSASMSNDTPSNDACIGNSNVLPSDKMRTLSLDSVGPEKTQSSSGVFSKKKASLVTTVMLVWLESFEDHLNFPLMNAVFHEKENQNSSSMIPISPFWSKVEIRLFCSRVSNWAFRGVSYLKLFMGLQYKYDLLSYTSTGLEGNAKIDPVRDCFVIFLHPLQNGLIRVKLQGPINRINIATPLVDGMIMSRRSAGQLVRQTVANICRRRRLGSDSYQLPHVRRRLKLQEIREKFECKMDPPELLTYLLKNC